MTYEEFVINVMNMVEDCPKCWRKEQSVFNIVNEKYGVARDVQFIDGIDCFYNDNEIDRFLTAAYIRIMNNKIL